MPEQLDQYISQLERYLRWMPTNSRAAELHEIQAHLQELIADKTARGANEGEAVSTALRQFGSPRHVATELRQTWRGPESWWRVPLAILGVLACAIPLWIAQYVAIHSFAPPYTTQCVLVVAGLSYWISPLLNGTIAGLIAPRRALLSIVGLQVISASLTAHFFLQIDWSHVESAAQVRQSMLMMFCRGQVCHFALACLSAYYLPVLMFKMRIAWNSRS